MTSYSKIGFGVDVNLSRFDFQSLDDPQGQHFLSEFLGKEGYCPIFKENHYEWVKVRVVGFDDKANQAIIER